MLVWDALLVRQQSRSSSPTSPDEEEEEEESRKNLNDGSLAQLIYLRFWVAGLPTVESPVRMWDALGWARPNLGVATWLSRGIVRIVSRFPFNLFRI